MVTNDRPPAWYLARAAESVPDDFVVPGRGDWGRLSRDAFIASTTVSARSIRSEGDLRLTGAGVEANSADLLSVGAIATAWQRALSATGAALEQVKSLRGSLPADVVQRTALVLSTSPQPGSVVLHVAPKADPLPEAEPDGDVPMVARERPLADRASEQLIEWLGRAANATLTDTEALSSELRDLGPRVGGSISALAIVLERSNITLDASWAEPETRAVRASITPGGAKWIAQFVAGRGLDAEEQTLSGFLRTISDRERWLVEVDGETVKMDASELDPSDVASWRVNDEVRLAVRVAVTERPDGTNRTTMTIIRVEPPPSTPDGSTQN